MNSFKLIPLEERIVLDAAIAAVIYVDVHASGANNGSSWANAYTDLQSALSQASTTTGADQIWVADGVYKPGSSPTSTFNIPDQVVLFGGFKGGEKNVNKRNPEANLTILSGDILGNDIAGNPLAAVVDPGYLASKLDNAKSIVTLNGATATLDGFTVTKGFNSDQTTGGSGGGLLALNSSHVTLRNMTFDDNFVDGRAVAVGSGGGAIAGRSNSTFDIEDSVFTNNTTRRVGGAISLVESNASISKSTFDSNRALLSGGAILASTTDVNPNTLSIERSSFINNRTESGSAGAIRNDGVNLTVSRSDFEGNFASTFAGAISSSATLADNVASISRSNFENNTSGNGAGAIFVLGSAGVVKATVNIDHSDFTGNSTVNYGGAIMMARSAAVVIDNSTFDGNTAGVAGGAISTDKTSNAATDPASLQLSIDDSKFYNNTAGNKGGAIYDNSLLSFTINDSKFRDNSSVNSGGAVHIDDLSATPTPIILIVAGRVVTINDSNFKDNDALKGGALTLDNQATLAANMIQLNVSHSAFIKNNATQAGAIYLSGGISTIVCNDFNKNNDALGDEIVVDLLAGAPMSVNGQTTAMDIVNSLVKKNDGLKSSEIEVLP